MERFADAKMKMKRSLSTFLFLVLENENEEFLEWLWSNGNGNAMKHGAPLFRKVETLAQAQMVAKHCAVPWNLFKQEFCLKACEFGDIDLMDIVCKSSMVFVHADGDAMFFRACERGHFPLAKWFVETHRVNVRKRNDAAIKMALSQQNAEAVAWIWQASGGWDKLAFGTEGGLPFDIFKPDLLADEK